ncbi:MAG: right-handed parallel beta-helix repeat-containing protein [Planctomycetota bacterium]|nr:right-handed parallel beta-helix repeat-containing protein [Planctomycetota bacterium]
MTMKAAGGFAAAAFLALAGLAGGGEMAADFFVAADGNDANPGTREKPFASLARARDAVRELKRRRGGLDRDVTVLIRGGTYRLKEPLAFGPEDSGTDRHTITYAAAPGERPVFSGGRAITGWKKGEGELWTAEIPEAKAGGWYFRELFVNGRRAQRARGPDAGFFRVARAGPDNRTSFTFNKGDLRAFRNIGDAEIVFLHDWCISRIRIAAVDEAAGTVRLADPVGCSSADFFAITGFEPHPRYYVENAPELLDSPGEWYLDRKSGVLSYWPLPGDDMNRAEAVAPVLERLLSFEGRAGDAASVRGLRFEGLTFMHCAFPLPEHGYAEIQAGFYEIRPNPGKTWANRARNPAAVALRNVSGCVLERCEFAHLGGSGVSIEGRSEGNQVVGCRVRDVGGNGIMVGEAENKPELLAGNNLVANNLVRDCGATLHGCVGIWVGLAEGTVVAHNEVRDLPYTGISVGWSWNTNPTQCRKNIVEANLISDVMQMLSDGGGIYTLGRQPGTVLRGNLIHGIPPNAGRSESNGMFLDEGSSEFAVENNAVYGVARAPIRFHKATALTIRRNALFVPGGLQPFAFNACGPEAMTFADNLVQPAPRTGPRTAGPAGRALACDGAVAREEVPHSRELEPARLTLEAWVRLPAYSAGDDPRRWVAGKNANEWENGHYALVVSGREVGAYMNFGGGRENCFDVWSVNSPLRLDRWHHLAMTYDGATLAVYLDGAAVGSRNVGRPRTPGSGPLVVGGRPDGFATGCFRGAVDEVRLHDRALSAGEVAARARAAADAPAGRNVILRLSFDDAGAGLKLPEWAAPGAGIEPQYRYAAGEAPKSP